MKKLNEDDLKAVLAQDLETKINELYIKWKRETVQKLEKLGYAHKKIYKCVTNVKPNTLSIHKYRFDRMEIIKLPSQTRETLIEPSQEDKEKEAIIIEHMDFLKEQG